MRGAGGGAHGVRCAASAHPPSRVPSSPPSAHRRGYRGRRTCPGLPAPGGTHAENTIAGISTTRVSFKCLDTGSGQKIPAMWHDTGAYPGVFVPET